MTNTADPRILVGEVDGLRFYREGVDPETGELAAETAQEPSPGAVEDGI